MGSAQATLEEEVHQVVADLFAGLLGVTLSEEVSAANLRIDNSAGSEDTRVSVFRLPWKQDYVVPGLDGLLHLEATAGALLGKDSLAVDTASGLAKVDQDWTIASAQLGAGWGFPLNERWQLRPGATLALAYLDNEAHYNEAGAIELAPLIDGLAVNWDGWALSPAANLTLERERDPTCLAFGFIGRFSLAQTRVFGTTNEAQEGSDSSRVLAARMELGAPIEHAGDGTVLSKWDVFAGGLQLGAVAPEALGFERFVEAGVGLSKDFAHLPPLRLSAGWIFGEDVRGYSLGISLDH